jgi:glucose/arabinose dehydrogenase
MQRTIRCAPLVACAFVVGLSVWLTACSDDATGPESDTMGPTGGVLSFASGMVLLTFPPGAVTQETQVTVVPSSTFPSDPALVSGTVFDFGPDGLQFAQSVQLTILYNAFNVPSGADEADLRLFRVSGGDWVGVAGSSVDVGEDAVTGSITGFSVFGVLAATSAPPVASVTVVPPSASVEVGGSVQLLAEARDAEGNLLEGRDIIWSSANTDIATVGQDGLVTGEAVGSVNITAASEEESGVAEITVTEPAPVASVTIDPASASMQVGNTVQLAVVLRDADGNVLEGRGVTWSSDDAAVASVDGDGLVTGEAIGTTMITATSEGQSGTADITVTAASGASLALELVVQGLSNPVYLTAPPGDTDRLFVVEQGGRILVVENGQLLGTPFLDISNFVSNGFEQGLLSVAFHPNYAENDFFYVNYTDTSGDTQVVRYSVSANPNVADAGSATPILSVDQPFSNHNGGLLLFGPDGMLFIGLGDGGSGGDPQDHGQNLGTLLGAMLRIDVDGGTPYAIPADNPYVDNPDALDEIWAHGLRNPWRYAVDVQANLLYIADVGQNAWEEVNVEPADAGGLNYGWNIMEGANCFVTDPCDQTGLILPALEYPHGPECSVTGGFVYRGTAIPALQGHYFYGDYCAGWVRSFRYQGGAVVDETEWFDAVGGVLSFGQDAAGELYVLTDDGCVQKMVPGL